MAAKARADARLVQAAAVAAASGSIPSDIGKPIGQNPANGQVEVRINPVLPDADKMQMILSAQNGRQIDFYGKVVDQFGAPVVGAKVRGVIVFSSVDGANNQDNYTVTDGSGLFKFNNLHGPNFGAVPSKYGYEYNERQPNNWRESYKPDPANPIIFPMYKLQGAEPMTHQNFIVMLPCDGTQTSINLRTGKAVISDGDMLVAFTRNPEQIHRGTPFEWTLTLEVPGGGLLEAHDIFPYEAPDSGYQETITITTGASPQSYINTASQTYYFKSSDGKYGRVTIGLHADYQPPPTLLGIEVYLNPSGSRNLEWDPAKEINPQ